jgi:CRISPR/Cas system-associated exonuclease Cas4 (RecB family)
MGQISLVVSASSQVRRTYAVQRIKRLDAASEAYVIGASRAAAADLVREVVAASGARLGLHALGLSQLVLRLAEPALAARGLAPAGSLAIEAVAARAAFEQAGRLAGRYFSPVLGAPGFARALSVSLGEVRQGLSRPDDLVRSGPAGRDLAALGASYERQLAEARVADRSLMLRVATETLHAAPTQRFADTVVLLLDVSLQSEAEIGLLHALAARAGECVVTIPEGDRRTSDAVAAAGGQRVALESPRGSTRAIERLRVHLFEAESPPEGTLDETLQFFSAPGEGREAVEIARRLLLEARRGVRLDDMAVLVRSPEAYLGLLEHALRRANLPAFFSRGTRRPDPTGRALLALLACAAENVSARRFAEYLSFGQVPVLSPSGGPPAVPAPWQPSGDEVLAARLPPAEKPDALPVPMRLPFEEPEEAVEGALAADSGGPVLAGTLRAPRQWEQLLAESAVIEGVARWRRRLAGLAAEYEVRRAEAARDDPESPLVAALGRAGGQLAHLQAFALPVVELLADFPVRARWAVWIERLEALAPRVLRRPERVLAVLADLRPMAEVGPVTLDEVRHVLTERLASTAAEPPRDRYGRVFVGTPDDARGRTFRVVFVPGLAERLFPQRPRQDPLLLDEARRALPGWHRCLDDRAADERLLLRVAVGAAEERIHFSYPRLEVAQSRPRVPSFYALDVMRAATGRVPDYERLLRDAARQADARLAWPAPASPDEAIDAAEYDLAVLAPWLRPSPDAGRGGPDLARGQARYLLEVSPTLARSMRAEYTRSRRRWTEADGLVRPGDEVRQALERQRPGRRPFSASALQRFASCPYQFLLSALYRLEPWEPPEALERLDPLTRGAMFHEMQRDFFRELRRRDRLPLTPGDLVEALDVVDRVLSRVAAEYEERLAPAIARVWADEIGAIRSDLRIWVRQLCEEGGGWVPTHFELSFGLPVDDAHDPDSREEPVVLDGRFALRGAIDLVERHRERQALRVTDHKTGRRRARPGTIIGGGTLLQPVLYSLAVEAALQTPVLEARLSYCTSAGEFSVHPVVLDEEARRAGLEAFEIVDRAVDAGMFPAAPKDDLTCRWCDFRPVCGPNVARRVALKTVDLSVVGDLFELRKHR